MANTCCWSALLLVERANFGVNIGFPWHYSRERYMRFFSVLCYPRARPPPCFKQTWTTEQTNKTHADFCSAFSVQKASSSTSSFPGLSCPRRDISHPQRTMQKDIVLRTLQVVRFVWLRRASQIEDAAVLSARRILLTCVRPELAQLKNT